MALSKKRVEIQRLIAAFEPEAAKFHDLRMGTFYVTQEGASDDRRFSRPNHTVMLWQYHGVVDRLDAASRLTENLQASNRKWGLRGAELTRFAVLEGAPLDTFLRMAKRAGGLFDKDESFHVKTRVTNEITEAEHRKNPDALVITVTNDDPLAIWLNYVLYHLSLTNPGREHASQIEPDPFALSLLALERLAEEQAIGKIDRSTSPIEDIRFKVALSFPGERRRYVAEVVDVLRRTLGDDAVFYDHDYQAQLARPNLDLLLQDIYRNRTDLIVVFLCAEYASKAWCGLEWRAVRDIIKERADSKVMFVRFDDNKVDGVFSIDGYVDARRNNPREMARLISSRIASQRSPIPDGDSH